MISNGTLPAPAGLKPEEEILLSDFSILPQKNQIWHSIGYKKGTGKQKHST
jgi:hypothetical protein